MAEQERDKPLPDADHGDSEGGRSGSGPSPAHEDEVTPTDQAVNNQEQALESGEENVV
jgi:hypothetical protein